MQISRQELLRVLGEIQPALAARAGLEQSTDFLLLNGKICAYNDEMLISCSGYPELSGSIRSMELLSLLSKMPDEEIDIETTDSEMRIKGARVDAGIALQAEISERIRAAVSELVIEHTWKPLLKDFSEIVHQASFAAGRDMAKPLLTCVHVTSQYVEACDNYRMARIAFPKRLQIKDLLLPARAIQNLSQYKPTQYAERGGWIHFKSVDDVQFSCRTMDGQYPDLNKLLEVEGSSVQFSEEVSESLERSGIFLDDSVTGNEACSIRLSDGTLEVSAKGVSGWIKERLDIEYTGDPIEFQVLPKALQSILKCHLSAVIGSRSILFKGEEVSYCCSIVAGK